ncbi:MAG: 4-hydroxyphenylacetate 3-hydroxylase N-terminal domain-containing protein [Candidatus Hodarchaeota archaeon]
MTVKTADEYLNNIQQMNVRVFLNGKRIEKLLDNPITRSVVEATAKIYELANDPQYEEVMTTKSHLLENEKISRANHPCRSTRDLELRLQMALLTAQALGTCNYRCPGSDAITALSSTTWEMDRELGTNYHERLNHFLGLIQQKDLACSAGLTDAKGDRSKRPGEQEDPDVYVRIVDRQDDGIVVRGAKLHQSGAIAVNYTFVLPGRALNPDEEDYAVSFVVPNSSKGLTYIAQWTPFSAERMMTEDYAELGNPKYGVRETSMVIFDDVFVPWNNVFMCGETAYAGKLISRFARMHRMNCGGACKVGFADLIIGATAGIAEYQGIAKSSKIREKLVNMMKIREAAYGIALAAALKGKEDPSGSGTWFPDDMYGNVAKLVVADGFWELMKVAGDIAGGLVVTMPSEEELKNPETSKYVKKYLKSAVPAEKRMRLTKFLQNWTAGLHGPGTWHGAGSTAAQEISIARLADLKTKKKLAEELAGIKD